MSVPKQNLATLTRRARRVRALYAKLETFRTSTPWTRAELAQGFVGDVGDLMKLVMAKEGRRPSKKPDVDAALAHELADCLWSILVLADAYQIDLEAAFLRTMHELESRLISTGGSTATLTQPRRTKTARTSRARRD